MSLPSRSLLALLALCQIQTALCFIEFFEPTTDDVCKYDSTNTYSLTGISASGGICAYNSDSAECYFCPPDQPKCWMWEISCTGGGNGSVPDASQVLCNNNGTKWCCSNVDDCLTGTDQNDICNPRFANPLSGISTASAIALAAESSIPPTGAVQTVATRSSSSTSSASALTSSSTSSSTPLASTPTSPSTASSTSSPISSSVASFTSSSESSLTSKSPSSSMSTSASTSSSSSAQRSASATTAISGGNSLRSGDAIGGVVIIVMAVIVTQF